jgi:hypothetical protein
METTYTMIGSDGLQYGPINLAQIRAWVAEGRITADTKILRSDNNAWLSASQYTELGLAPTAVAASGPAVAVAPAPMRPASVNAPDPLLVRRVHTAASWFFFIGAFSVVNTFILRNSGTFFLIGLGVNFLISNVVVNIVVSGVFALFGVFVRKAHIWAFIVGMVFYALDALIFLQAQMWLPLAFHAYALFRIFLGLQAAFKLKETR